MKQPSPRVYTILLAGAASVALSFCAGTATAQSTEPTANEQVVQPDIARRKIHVPKIDTENVEIGAYYGILSVEDFGARAVYGGRVALHATEDLFLEAIYGMSTITDEALCNNGLCLLPNRVEDLTYYAASVGVNLMPSEVFFGKRTAMAAAVYLLAGVGNTSYVNESRFTVNVGLGIRILPWDWLAVHVTMRDFIYESDFLGTTKMTNNFELTAGLSVYF